MRQKAIRIKGLSFQYEGGQGMSAAVSEMAPEAAISDISLTFDAGTLTVLIGPSGCGKTTLCKCLAGVIPRLVKGTLTGQINLLDREITAAEGLRVGALSQIIGLVLQEPDNQIVMPVVEDDLAFGPENMMRPPEEIQETVRKLTGMMELSRKAAVNPSKLSGGEKQRLAIGGVLALDPEIIVFDEPVSNLDAAGKRDFVKIVSDLKAAGKTLVVAEHDFEIFDFADTWVLMKSGRVLLSATPQDVPALMLEHTLWT
jgi:energy-coupling factor transporter ATP-binding protein EcfA2